ncbi:MAG: DUF5655 domain-containing protein [Chthonomonadales bacterium]
MANEPGEPIPGTPYHVHPSFAMESASAASLLTRTGKSIEEWAEIVRKDGPADPKLQQAWLKATHGITTNYAMWIYEKANRIGGAENYRPVDSVEALFAGKKAELRPIYEAILEFGKSLGEDVMVCPCQSMVPFYCRNVFATVKPTTLTRVDLGLCLRGEPFSNLLIDTGGTEKKDRITHRIALTCVDDFDDSVKLWFRLAYVRCAR